MDSLTSPLLGPEKGDGDMFLLSFPQSFSILGASKDRFWLFKAGGGFLSQGCGLCSLKFCLRGGGRTKFGGGTFGGGTRGLNPLG